MLEFLKVKNPDQIKSLLKTYDPLKDTWIVSDLKSKQEIQNAAIEKYNYYTDDAIMRVSDFWRLWIRRIEPTLQVVSSDFIKSLVQHFVDMYGEKLEIIDSEVSSLNKAVQEFAPILLHPGSDDILQEWLEAQATGNGSDKKWRRWYQLAKVCTNYIVYEKKVIDAKWSAAYLQTLDLSLLSWNRKLFVDLGSELTTVEMGLFKHISLSQIVTIITPDPVWKDKFPYLLNTYKENFGYGDVKEFSDCAGKSSLPRKEQFIRLSTQLAEIKYAVASIRQWADSGVALDAIAIISADIEKYWPVLQFYLEEDGLSYKKEIVSQLNSLGGIQNLTAALKNVSPDVAWDSLEKTFFSNDLNTNGAMQFKYEQFKALFYQLYDEDDLGREQKIKNLFYKKVDFNADIDRDEFLAYLVKTWFGLPHSNNKSELFELIFKDFLAQSLNIKIKFGRWVHFLKNRMSHKEIVIKKSPSSGISVLPLMSAQMINVTHRIYIGLNDEYYHKRQNSMMALSDSIALKTQFDLAVDFSEESYLDFNLRWQSLASSENCLFTTSHISFTSEPLNSSIFFIENSPQSEVVQPQTTRVDELQRQLADFKDVKQVLPIISSVSAERLLQDINGYQSHIPSDIFRKLSVSDTENYAQCSFKLLASKGFRLRDFPQVALDLDPRQKGSLVHALFEYCINLMISGEYNPTKVSEFLDNKRSEFNIYNQQEAYWKIQKSKFLQLAHKFYEFEKSRVKIFSVSTEKSYEMFFDLDKQLFTNEKPDSFFSFNIRLDRIDTHKVEKYSIIYDYKSSAYQVSNFSSWITEQQFQMMLYMIALELAFSDESRVKGALYYQYKTFDLKKGLIAEEVGLNDFALTKRNKSLIDPQKKSDLRARFNSTIIDVLQRLNKNEFSTLPNDLDICKKCDWRKLCRATHLM